jgi:hypothetical protein
MRAVAIVGLCLVAIAGCGSDGFTPPVPVKGKVTLGGKPVEGALVTFHNKTGGRSASGKTEKDGTFKLTCINTDDGAPPGDFNVSIKKVEAKGGGDAGVDISSGNFGADYGAQMAAAASGTTSKLLKDAIPAKYGDPTQSGLTRSVVKGEPNDFVFDLK